MIRAEIKSDIRGIGKKIDKAHADVKRAQVNAIKVEGFSLMATLRQAILMGRPAPGVRWKDLSVIARGINRKTGLRQPSPLRRLAAGVTYQVDAAAQTMAVGFTKRSPRWARRAAELQQAGFTKPVTPEFRLYLRRRGAQRSFSRSRRNQTISRYFFLKLTTRKLETPARPIIAPFWAAERSKSEQRIRRNFRLIARGQGAPGGALYDVREMGMW
jgi:hypothetical protein